MLFCQLNVLIASLVIIWQLNCLKCQNGWNTCETFSYLLGLNIWQRGKFVWAIFSNFSILHASQRINNNKLLIFLLDGNNFIRKWHAHIFLWPKIMHVEKGASISLKLPRRKLLELWIQMNVCGLWELEHKQFYWFSVKPKIQTFH